MNPGLREALRPFIPPVVESVVRRARARWRGRTPLDDEVEALRQTFLAQNRGIADQAVVFRPGLPLLIHPDSRIVLEAFCFASPPAVREMDCFMDATRGKSRLLDVGALHGVFSLVFASQGTDRRALAVDPSPVAFAKLLYNIYKNKLATITPVECALSDQVGRLQMHYEWEHVVAAGLGEPEESLEIPRTTGDALCQQYAFEPDTIKIDVEGHEIKVLRGLKNVIGRCAPLIFLETHPSRIAQEGDQPQEAVEFLAKLGYRAASVSGPAVPLQHLFAIEDRYRLTV